MLCYAMLCYARLSPRTQGKPRTRLPGCCGTLFNAPASKRAAGTHKTAAATHMRHLQKLKTASLVFLTTGPRLLDMASSYRSSCGFLLSCKRKLV